MSIECPAVTAQLLKLKLVSDGVLEFVGPVSVPGVASFDPRAHFVVSHSPQNGKRPQRQSLVKISLVGARFDHALCRCTSPGFAPTTIAWFRVVKPMPDLSVHELIELWREERQLVVQAARQFELLKLQPNGESGPLLVQRGAQRGTNWFIDQAPGDGLVMTNLRWPPYGEGWQVDAEHFDLRKIYIGDHFFAGFPATSEE